MRQTLVIFLFVFVTFLTENVLSEFFGWWLIPPSARLTPNLLIILVVFFNSFRGIRYGLLTAFLAGLFRDSFGVNVFGLNIVAFMACAYLASFIKVYIHPAGSNAARVLTVFFMSLIYVCIQYALHVTLVLPSAGQISIDFAEMFVYILIPEVLTTTIVTVVVFERFKRCALKLFA